MTSSLAVSGGLGSGRLIMYLRTGSVLDRATT